MWKLIFRSASVRIKYSDSHISPFDFLIFHNENARLPFSALLEKFCDLSFIVSFSDKEGTRKLFGIDNQFYFYLYSFLNMDHQIIIII